MSRPDDQLATLVRDAAPRPSDEFLERLDARVAERFGKPEGPRRAWSARAKWRLAGGLAAACAAGAAVVVVATGGRTGDEVTPLSNESTRPATVAEEPAPIRRGATATAAPSASAAAPST